MYAVITYKKYIYTYVHLPSIKYFNLQVLSYSCLNTNIYMIYFFL